jgi:hypothetical protein
MDENRNNELTTLVEQYFKTAILHFKDEKDLNEHIMQFISNMTPLKEESEIPSFENKPMPFGKIEYKEFIVVITDIRESTKKINEPNGELYMFIVSYIYSGIIANIVNYHNGTSTEFTGDGAVNLFEVNNEDRKQILQNAMIASQEILDTRIKILNPFFRQYGLPIVNIGIGISHGMTRVTRFGYGKDTDLKAFGGCVHNAAKLNYGMNDIRISKASQDIYPKRQGGRLIFTPIHAHNEKKGYIVNRK